jgi:hypothetical protein
VVKRIVVDCATGEQRVIDASPDDLAEIAAREQAHAADQAKMQQAKQQREADIQQLRARARNDPDFAALVRVILQERE